MNKILVAMFDTEPAAFEGLTALKDLHQSGDITLYASSVIAKDSAGKVVVREAADSGPLGTLVGVVVGGLVGLIGGPIGSVVGAYVGAVGGLMYDLFTAGVGTEFMSEISDALTPGKVAVVADVDESWTAPVDTRLAALGAVTFRRYSDDVLDEQLTREADAAEAEMTQLNEELKHSQAEAKAAIEAQIASQREKTAALVARIDKAIADEQARAEARVATLKAQLAAAREDQRKRIEARIDEAKASRKAREGKLDLARMHARAAFLLAREAVRA